MYIVKVGGGSEINLPGIVGDLAELEEPFVVVLGANALRDEIGRKMGLEKKLACQDTFLKMAPISL